jgi:thermitase
MTDDRGPRHRPRSPATPKLLQGFRCTSITLDPSIRFVPPLFARPSMIVNTTVRPMQILRACKLALILIVMSCVAASILPAAAQNRFAVETTKRPLFDLSVIGMKLAPELRPAVAANAPFIGLTKKGNPVLEFPSSIKIDTAKDTLASVKLSGTQLSSDSGVAETKRLLVFMTNPSSLPEGSIANLPIVRRNVTGGYVVVESSSRITPENLRALAESPAVRYVEPDFSFSLDQNSTPDDPEYTAGKLWGLKSINAPIAWTILTKSKTIVGVIDTGIDYTHEDLAANMWSGPNSTHGYNFINNNTDPNDKNGHGTHVAGIIGAVGNNGEGVVGVNWGVPIMALQVFDSDGHFSGSDNVVRAIDFAIANKAKIINASWNGPNFSQALKEAINRAEAAGLLIVAAAGNDDGSDNDVVPTYPASYANPNIIAVLSIDQNGHLASRSNFGKTSVQIGAPGESIDSSVPGNQYKMKSGTSMAAAFVSGAAALVWSMPNFEKKSAAEIKALILGNARSLAALGAMDTTGGTLDLSFTPNPAALSAQINKTATTFQLQRTSGIDTDVLVQTAHNSANFELSPATRGFYQTLKELGGEPVTISGAAVTGPDGRPQQTAPR